MGRKQPKNRIENEAEEKRHVKPRRMWPQPSSEPRVLLPPPGWSTFQRSFTFYSLNVKLSVFAVTEEKARDIIAGIIRPEALPAFRLEKVEVPIGEFKEDGKA